MTRTIVVPVNFTPASTNAARYATDLAQAIGGRVQLIHVLKMPFSAAEVPMPPDFVFEDMHRSAVAQLKVLSEELTKRARGKVKMKIYLELGGFEYKLKKHCQREKPFMIIMGPDGSPLERILGKNKTINTLRHLHYPLLVIPEKAVFHGIKKILLACDMEDIDSGLPDSLDFLTTLRDLFDASFDVVNVTTQQEPGEGQKIFKFDSWNARLQGLSPDLYFVRTADIAGGIAGYLENHPIDWVMVFPKKHGLLSMHHSQAKRIVLHVPVPVMSIHE